MSIFITGASGIVGGHLLLKILQENPTQEVRVLIRNEQSVHDVQKLFSNYVKDTETLIHNCRFMIGNLLDISSLEECIEPDAVVYHCAALVSFDSKKADEMFQVNVQGTANLVNICLEKKIQKLCYVSSVAALGFSVKGELITEEHYWENSNQVSSYSKSKYFAEMEVWRGIEEGLTAVIVNPSMIIGPGKWGDSSTSFFPTLNKGLAFYPTGGTGFVAVQDVVHAMITLMHSPIHSERFILAGENLSFQAFFSLVARALGKKTPTIEVTGWIGTFAWIIAGFMNFFKPNFIPITKESVQRTKIRNYYTHQKIKDAIPLEFTPIEQAVSTTAKFYISQL